MTRRYWLFALVLLTAFPLFAARRRAVTPGANRCVYGTLDESTAVSILTVDATHVYWWDDFFLTVKRAPKTGGAVEVLASGMPLIVYDLEVDDTNVYLASLPDDGSGSFGPGEIGRVPKDGGEYLTIARVQFPAALSTDNAYVYYANAGTIDAFHGTALADGQIVRIDKDGAHPRILAGSLSIPLDVHIDGEDVFFSETGLATENHNHGIRRVAKTGGQVTHIDDTYAAGEMTSNATDIFYYGGETDGPIGGLLRVPKTGGLPAVLVQDPDLEAGPIVQDDFVYYVTILADDTEVFVRVPVAGGTAEVLFEPKIGELSFGVDGCGLYWGSYDGRLIKAPR